jgi:glycosyltransferase involved in cell wall biosynthesis
MVYPLRYQPDPSTNRSVKILFFANTDWYLYNFRLALARHLRDRGHDVVMLSPPGPYVAKLQAAGFRALTVPLRRRSLNPLRELALFHHIRQLYARERPDLAHHFTLKCVVYGALAARLSGVSARVNAVTGLGHVFTSDHLKARLLRPPVRALLGLALGGASSRLIVQNPDDHAAIHRAGLIDPAHIRLIRGSGVDTERFRPGERDPLLPNPPPPGGRELQSVTLLLASRLLWEKGIGEYVAAARQLRREGIAAEFLLAGEPDPGNPASIPPEQLDRWRREGDVTLLGHVDDMPALLAQTDIAVLPSYREGTPRSLLEAAACGLPLVATDAPGCREIVHHKINGLLVPIKDATALAAALRRLCREPETRQRLGQASRAKALAAFDERIVFEQTLAVYRELIERP